MSQCELLAPAGSVESAHAALYCGADAIYIGLKNFSARQNAVNFDYSELDGVLSLCRLFGAKLYVALNTIVFDTQLEKISECISRCVRMGVDAFIVQDLGVLELIRQISPDIPIHASTQMTVHTPNGALMAKSLGISRVVVARELSEKQIEQICKTGVEVEAFVHGALCMSVSGQCYMSAMIGRRSANRGLCAQPCRLPFCAVKGDNYALSLKDLSLIEHIDKLKKAGVSSLKIEGRMKRPEYVAAATYSYRNALDSKPYDTETLRAVFSRSGFTDGYFTANTGKKMFGVRSYDDVAASASVLSDWQKLYELPPKIYGVDFNIKVCDDNLRIKAESNGVNAEYFADISQYSQMRPLDKQSVQKQLSKLGGTVFALGSVTYDIPDEDGLRMPVSAINAARRMLVETISEEIILKNTPKFTLNELKASEHKKSGNAKLKFRAQFSSLDQLVGLPDSIIDMLEMFSLPLKMIEENTESLNKYKEKIAIYPPRFIFDEKDIENRLLRLRKKGFDKLVCTNIAYFALKSSFELLGHFGLNAANSLSVKTLADIGLSDCTISLETKLNTAFKISRDIPIGIVAYGKIPLMLNVNCPIKDCRKCRRRLIDRTGCVFEVKCPKINEGCAEILNSQTLEMSDKQEELHRFDFVWLIFNDENAEECAKVILRYKNGGDIDKNDFTRGLYYRGVE